MEYGWLTSVLILAIVCDAEPAILHFSVIVSSAETFNSSGSVPSIDLAIKTLHEQSVLPEGYSLAYSIQDSECDQLVSLNAFFSEIFYSNVTKVGLIGCGCPVATEPVGLINRNWNIPLISPEPTETQLSDGMLFPHQFQLFPSGDNLLPAYVALITQFEWKRVFIITQDENLFISVFRSLSQELLRSNLQWKENRISPIANLTAIRNLFGNEGDDFRVFFLNMDSNLARSVLCEASNRGLTYPRYAWITNGDYIDGWWMGNTSCSDEAVASVLDRALAIQLHPVAPPNHTTDVGLTPAQFFSHYRTGLSSYQYTYVSALAYDAVWTLASALNTSVHLIRSGNDSGCEGESGNLVPWENFTYSNSKMGCILMRALQGTKFYGVSGPVEFNLDGSRVYNVVTILQYQKGSRGISAFNIGYSAGGNFSYSTGYDTITVYPIIVPPDGTALNITNGFSLWLTAVCFTWSSIGVLLTLAFGVFNFVCRERKVIKLTSPNLNYFLIAGVLVTFISTYVRLYPDISQFYVTLRCSLQNWLNAVGYSLAFGTILAKMFRVYYIFNNPSPSKKTLSDFHLMLIVLGVIGICLILLTIGEAVPSFRPAVVLLSDDENPPDSNEYGVKQNYLVWQCYESSSQLSYLSVTLIYVYLAILQIIALILAIKTRKVKIKTLNDSKYVAALIYISSITLAILALLTFSLGAYLNLTAAVYNGGILFVTTLFLLLLFVPKMYWLYKDPNGENIFIHTTTNNELPKTGVSIIEDLQNEVNYLRSKLKNLEGDTAGIPIAKSGTEGVEVFRYTVNDCDRLNSSNESGLNNQNESRSDLVSSSECHHMRTEPEKKHTILDTDTPQ